jgi:hypothetical protein
MSRQLRTLLLAAAMAITVASCGAPRNAAPTIIPGGVVNPALAAADSQPRLGDGTEIFLVQAEHLVAVRRNTPRRELVDVLNLLLQGPTQAEFGAGIRSAISPQTTLRSVLVEGNTGIVDLSGALVEVGGQEQILAVAQLVLTATAVPGIGQIRFLLEGQSVEVPRADGTLTSETLRAADYSGLLR